MPEANYIIKILQASYSLNQRHQKTLPCKQELLLTLFLQVSQISSCCSLVLHGRNSCTKSSWFPDGVTLQESKEFHNMW